MTMPVLKFKTLVNFPAQVQGQNGITVTKTAGVFYIGNNYADFTPVGPVPADAQVLLYSPINNSYALGSLTTVAGIADAPLDGKTYNRNNGAWVNGTHSIEAVIDGGGIVIATGLKGYLEVPFACTINQATLLADRSGSIVVDIFKCSYASFDASSTHPVAGDKITASAPPTITSAVKSQDATLTGWTTALSAGDILAFNVNSATTIQRATLSLRYTR